MRISACNAICPSDSLANVRKYGIMMVFTTELFAAGNVSAVVSNRRSLPILVTISICATELTAPNNGPAPSCALNDCLQCDEDEAGPIFTSFAGSQTSLLQYSIIYIAKYYFKII